MFLLEFRRQIISLGSFALLLSGCNNESPKVVSVPTLPVIQHAVSTLVPLVAGKRNDFVMQQACALARGESSREQVFQALKKQGVDLRVIPPKGHALSLLVTADGHQLNAACASYVATMVMVPPNLGDFMTKAPDGASVNAKGLVVEPKKLSEFLRVQLAISRATAELYTSIAVDLGGKPGLTMEQYEAQTRKLFIALAPKYLQKVKAFYAQGEGVSYNVLKLSTDELVFASSSGYGFSYDYYDFQLSLYGVPWLGRGKLLGEAYDLRVSNFDAGWADSVTKRPL
ncbi:primase C-terminal domain-containing protein [Pseudomonas shahriarae]|uniref:Lipoprotein n=1 Tax=Pseudomonas shahriarae TaxID=2745512 RepID=A0ABT5NBP5_9PSED|nr:primase C-terminal domain-containing protein [Pseudomonas shahriarae]MDD0985965.1 hypothetical protein [Pseudomonas shahriarae]MDD1033202.1 hypothetical protein [Pseudomonas shahriarae]